MLSEYENTQFKEIEQWKNQVPSVVSKVAGATLTPVTWVINKIVPEVAIRKVLDFSSTAAEKLTDKKDILRDAGVNSIDDLKTCDLERSDNLANDVHNWAIGLASAVGGATGAAGLPGFVIDIPAVIVQALRVIHKIGICYGFEVKTEEDKEFILAILAASGANTMEEKVTALEALQAFEVVNTKDSWKSLAKKAAKKQMVKDAGIIGIKNLSKQLGINLTKRKILQFIPAIGAIVGASVNAWYIKEVGWAARRAFQERWLIENNKITDI